MNKELQQAFEETHFIVHHTPPFTLRIGWQSPELDALLQATGHSCAAFITAWNPMCHALDPTENHQRQQRLINELNARNLTALLGIGQHPNNGWPGEESFLILGIQLEEAKALARKFEQFAFVWAQRNGVAELITMQTAPPEEVRHEREKTLPKSVESIRNAR